MRFLSKNDSDTKKPIHVTRLKIVAACIFQLKNQQVMNTAKLASLKDQDAHQG
jgi:hypothetical protein